MRRAFVALLELTGFAAVIGGLWLVFPPVAIVAAGVLLVAGAQALNDEEHT